LRIMILYYKTQFFHMNREKLHSRFSWYKFWRLNRYIEIFFQDSTIESQKREFKLSQDNFNWILTWITPDYKC